MRFLDIARDVYNVLECLLAMDGPRIHSAITDPSIHPSIHPVIPFHHARRTREEVRSGASLYSSTYQEAPPPNYEHGTAAIVVMPRSTMLFYSRSVLGTSLVLCSQVRRSKVLGQVDRRGQATRLIDVCGCERTGNRKWRPCSLGLVLFITVYTTLWLPYTTCYSNSKRRNKIQRGRPTRRIAASR